ncbi:hypothetical protein EV122DRAFT_203461 [Schizophyllum commune]
MSYAPPFPGQYAGSQSNPPTPHEGATSTWESLQQAQSPQHLQQQQKQQQQQSQPQQQQQEAHQETQHPDLSPHSIYHTSFDDPLSQSGLPDFSSFNLPPIPPITLSSGPSNEAEPGRPAEPRNDQSRVFNPPLPPLPSLPPPPSLSSTPGMQRTSHASRRLHPYQRPSSVAPRQTPTVPSQHVRFGQSGPIQMQSRHPSSSSSSGTSPITGIAGHLAASGVVQQAQQSAQATSPITLPSAHFPPLAQGGERVSRAPYRSRPLGLRTEEYYDEAAGEYSVHLEVPGVRRSDLSITLAKNAHSRAQEIVIQGQRQDPTAEGKQTRICSRLVYGRFRQVLPVGNEVKGEDIVARLANGILTITVHVGPPITLPAPQNILIL